MSLVAVIDGKVIGYCLGIIREYPRVHKVRQCGEINDIAVTQHYRKKGIGTKLFRTVTEWFTSKGIHRLEAKVATSNLVSVNFWKKLGFRSYESVVFKKLQQNTPNH